MSRAARPAPPPPARVDYAALEKNIGHVFADRGLLELALTHVSALPPAQAKLRIDSYQRLEFLGDRVLGLAVAALLYERFPAAEEGELSRRLAALVRKETCADIAREWQAGAFVKLGEGEAQSGGAQKNAILGDVCESLLGAIYLDAGIDAAEQVVHRFFAPRMSVTEQVRRDPKTALQEWAQARGLPPPVYRLAERAGPDHAPVFTIEAQVAGFEPAQGQGASKRFAEQASAEAFLRREGVEENFS